MVKMFIDLMNNFMVNNKEVFLSQETRMMCERAACVMRALLCAGGVDMGVHSPFLSGGQDVVSPLSQPSPYAGSLLPSGLQQQQQHPLARQSSYGTVDMSQILAMGNKSPNKPMSTMLPDG